jgi:hypothetical protein
LGEERIMQVIKIKDSHVIPEGYTGIVEYPDGGKDWFLNGKLHREDGPAREYADGNKKWYLNGECHREDGPAVEWSEEFKDWYLNNKLVFMEGGIFDAFFQKAENQDDDDYEPSLFIEEIVKVIEPIKKFHFIFGKYLCSEGIFYKGIRWEPVP